MRARLPGPGHSALLRLAIAPVLLVGAVILGLVAELPAETQTQLNRSSDVAGPSVPGSAGPHPSPRAVVRSVLPTLPADGAPFLSRSSHQVRLGDVVMRFDIATGGWESHGLPYVAKSVRGSQGAEAIVYWMAVPRDDSSRPCTSILGSLAEATPRSLAQAVVSAPGVAVLSDPTDGRLGGGSSVRVDVRLERYRGCVPGYLVEWQPSLARALFENISPGDTIRIWFVDVQGTILIVAAATHPNAGQNLTEEVLGIVDSIVFSVRPA